MIIKSYDQDKDAVERQPEGVDAIVVDQLHEIVVIDVLEQIIEVKHIQSQTDAGRDGQQGHHGNHHVFEQVVEPSGAKHQGLLAWT